MLLYVPPTEVAVADSHELSNMFLAETSVAAAGGGRAFDAVPGAVRPPAAGYSGSGS